MESIAQSSRFWTNLNEQHREELDQFGIEEFKRHQALKYFTWRWHSELLRESEQLRFLARATRPLDWFRAAITPADLSDRAWRGVDWTRTNRWLYTLATRVIWEYAGRHDAASVQMLAEPHFGNPLPVRWRGRLISQDLSNTALEVAAMVRALGGRSPSTILEVGAGYGRTAHALLNVFPNADYVIVDIEPARSISEYYLSKLFPRDRVRHLTPGEIGKIKDGEVDLVVSISSLHEMTRAQVKDYLTVFDRVAGDGVVYLKQWTDWFNPDDKIRMKFDEYPIPERWRKVFSEKAPIQTSFTQGAWDVPAAP